MEAALLNEAGDSRLHSSQCKKGGWISFPFIIGTMVGLSVGAGGWISNLIVYLIQEFNFKSIDAAQVFNVVNGCTTMLPIVGAVFADSFLGCFSAIWICSIISVLGTVVLTITATVDSLRPPACKETIACTTPSGSQLAVLYTGLTLVTLGVGGTRFTLATMGANQFNTAEQQGIFFNWFIFALYTANLISFTFIVYVEDNISWGLGFGLCFVVNVVATIIFFAGSRFYRREKLNGSPFTGLARVLVAAFRKRNLLLSSKGQDYCQEPKLDVVGISDAIPTQTFKFLNHAALKSEEDITSDGSIARPWRLCTVQQVEDFKILIKIIPLWSTGMFQSIPLALQTSLVTLQALTMDRRLIHHFEIPAGTMLIFIVISCCVVVVFIDRIMLPIWKKFFGRPLPLLQRIGIGHVFTIVSMILSAIVESKRLKVAKSNSLQQDQNGAIVPMFVIWLVPQLAIAGAGEAFHFPGQIALYYKEFPTSLKSTSTAMVAMYFGIAYYLGNALTDFLRKVTNWLPDDINHGRLDNVYWVLTGIAGLNFCYYLVCSCLYKYQIQNAEKVEDDGSQ